MSSSRSDTRTSPRRKRAPRVGAPAAGVGAPAAGVGARAAGAEAHGSGAATLERVGPVAWLRFGSARGGSALSGAIHAELARLATEIDHDESVRAVVLASRGAVFSEGDGADAPPPDMASDAVRAIAALRVPVVALLHGLALDAGLELALACDLRIGARGLRLGLTQVTQGTLPSRGGTQRLPRIVGRALALRMLLLGEHLPADRARAAGLLCDVVPRRDLDAAGHRLARELARRGPIAQRFAKEALRAASDLPLAEGLRFEGDLYVLLQSTNDREEGMASFRAKRAPQFDGT